MFRWPHWMRHARHWLPGASALPEIPDALWHASVQEHAFLQQLSTSELQQLRVLCAHFLKRKEFTGAHGLQITDAMAMAVAIQACVLLLHWGKPARALRWYDDFVGIVLYPGDARAHRTLRDDAGVVHHYTEDLMGEAMEGGPVMLSWDAMVREEHTAASHTAWPHRSNVVIHEFAHKLDMANGGADGCPPLPAGFMGLHSAAEARQLWAHTWLQAYQHFCDAVAAHERFGQPPPWLDHYAATSPAEFFAVACEAYWVAPAAFSRALPTLKPLLDALFQRPIIPADTDNKKAPEGA